MLAKTNKYLKVKQPITAYIRSPKAPLENLSILLRL